MHLPVGLPRPMPERLGRYEIRAKIGEGGMAVVYLGHRPADASAASSERVAAVKVIKDEYSLNTDFVTMFLDEAKIVSRLDHANVVRVYELGHEGNRLFIAMELLFGQSLWSIWNACRDRRIRLRYDLLAWIGARVAEGLHHAHELRGPDGELAHLVHRDMNASNIFVTYDGQVKIIDFGLAKAAGRMSKTAVGVVKGKLAYMSPEQAVGHTLDRRSDIFTLGTTLWEISCDRRLFKGTDDLDTLKRVYAATVPDPTRLVEGYPEGLWGVLRRALVHQADARYPTALAFARELDAFAASAGRAAGPSVVGEVMDALFRGERQRQAAWIEDASDPSRRPRGAFMPASTADVSVAPPPVDEQLFSGPARTLRDPAMAEQQAATAQGGFSKAETGGRPAPPAPTRAPQPAPRAAPAPAANAPVTAMATLVTLALAAVVLAGVIVVALMMRRG